LFHGFGIDNVQDGWYRSGLLFVVFIHFIFLVLYTLMCKFLEILCRKLKIDYNPYWLRFQGRDAKFCVSNINKKFGGVQEKKLKLQIFFSKKPLYKSTNLFYLLSQSPGNRIKFKNAFAFSGKLCIILT